MTITTLRTTYALYGRALIKGLRRNLSTQKLTAPEIDSNEMKKRELSYWFKVTSRSSQIMLIRDLEDAFDSQPAGFLGYIDQVI